MKLVKHLLVIIIFFQISIFSNVVQSDHVESELISEVESIQPGQPFWVALRLKMEEHWHTYWLNAGDAGLKTTIDWNLPEGFSASEIYWPFPQKIYLDDFANYGYEGETFLLVKITPPQNISEKEIELKANANWLVCKIACQPGGAEHYLKLSIKNKTPKPVEEWRQAFDETISNLPINKSDWSISSTKNEEGIKIFLVPPSQNTDVDKIEFFPYEGGIYNNAAPQKFVKNKNGFELTIPFDDFKVSDPNSLKGILVSNKRWNKSGDAKALEINIPFKK